MSSHLLRYQSPEKVLGIGSNCPPHSTTIDSWRISETYQSNTHEYLQKGMGSYRLVLEKEVSTQEEVWSALHGACQIAEELDLAWCYVCGTPFLAMRPSFIDSEAPAHWTGNTREIEVEIHKERGVGYAVATQVVNSHWLSLPFLPLKKVLAVREAYLKAPPVIRDLIELHVAAHKSDRGNLFFLAKGLELAGAFFGQARADRNSRLQEEMVKIGIASHLTQSVAWLFEMANTRFDVRHVVNGYSPVNLHPRMTDSERQDFVYNSDILLRAFICQRLGIEIIL